MFHLLRLLFTVALPIFDLYPPFGRERTYSFQVCMTSEAELLISPDVVSS
jgi:hypothetical protein